MTGNETSDFGPSYLTTSVEGEIIKGQLNCSVQSLGSPMKTGLKEGEGGGIPGEGVEEGGEIWDGKGGAGV